MIAFYPTKMCINFAPYLHQNSANLELNMMLFPCILVLILHEYYSLKSSKIAFYILLQEIGANKVPDIRIKVLAQRFSWVGLIDLAKQMQSLNLPVSAFLKLTKFQAEILIRKKQCPKIQDLFLYIIPSFTTIYGTRYLPILLSIHLFFFILIYGLSIH